MYMWRLLIMLQRFCIFSPYFFKWSECSWNNCEELVYMEKK